MAHTSVTLLDGSLGTAMPGDSGGHVIPVPSTMNAGVALRLAKEAAAAAANTPVYAAAQPQRIVVLGFGQVAMYKDWSGPVHRYTAAGQTEIVKAS